MATQLRIRWDGEAPGIAEHRLSLATFGVPMELLLSALRRIATQMVGAALENEQPKTGRFANLARGLDIEIKQIEGNSTGFDGIVSFQHPPQELPLFGDLPDRATMELLDSIDAESKGLARHGSVRKYLKSIPPSIHKQFYEIHDNGTTKHKVEIGDLNLADIPVDLPSFLEVEGDLIGVGFDPGRNEVRLKGDGGTTSFGALEAQVDESLKLRNTKIRALGIHDGKHGRLLRLTPASEGRYKVTPESIEENIYKKWAGVFARLSKA
jgi:hypothetical protein